MMLGEKYRPWIRSSTYNKLGRRLNKKHHRRMERREGKREERRDEGTVK